MRLTAQFTQAERGTQRVPPAAALQQPVQLSSCAPASSLHEQVVTPVSVAPSDCTGPVSSVLEHPTTIMAAANRMRIDAP
jgi:hypothetical protein